MESVLKALAIYGVIFFLTRISGRRTLSQATPFDVVLVLLIAEAAQSALVGSDGSLTNAVLIIATLILTDVLLSFLKVRAPSLALLIEGAPTILIHEGQLRRDAIRRARVSTEDILEAARRSLGLSDLGDIRFAVLETSGVISVIPFAQTPSAPAQD